MKEQKRKYEKKYYFYLVFCMLDQGKQKLQKITIFRLTSSN